MRTFCNQKLIILDSSDRRPTPTVVSTNPTGYQSIVGDYNVLDQQVAKAVLIVEVINGEYHVLKGRRGNGPPYIYDKKEMTKILLKN